MTTVILCMIAPVCTKCGKSRPGSYRPHHVAEPVERLVNIVNQGELQAGRAHLESWGPNKTYNLGLGRQALKTIDKGGVLTKLLNDTGYGNHPVILQSLFELGQQLQEGGFISATASLPAGQRTHAQVLYGDDHPN